MADLGTVELAPTPTLAASPGDPEVFMVPEKAEPPFTGIPITGQIWPRSRTTVVEEGMNRTVSVISSNTTMAAAARTDYVYVCSGTITVTLPTAVDNTNIYTVKNVGTGVVTVATTSSQTIDGASTFTIDVQYMSMDFTSNGTNWVIV